MSGQQISLRQGSSFEMKVKVTREQDVMEFLGLNDCIEDIFDLKGADLEIFDPELDIVNFVEKCDKNRFQCNFCPKSYRCKRSFIRHADYHEGRYTCPLCMQKCTSKSTLDIHFARHRKNGVQVPFTNEDDDVDRDKENVTKTHIWCSLCKRYVRKTFVQFHLKRSHVNEKRIENLQTLLHLLEAQENKQLFKCNLCDKSYDNYSSLKTHRNIHSKKFMCQICNKANASLTALRRHFKSHKIDCGQENLEHDKNYVFCDICCKYVNKFRLTYHRRTAHDKQFPTCEYCKRSFQTKAVRKNFTLIH